MPSQLPQNQPQRDLRQRRFEGDTLEEVIYEVRSAYGPHARISEANRVRRGGIAGFFTKERVEVVVDVTEGGVVAGARQPTPNGTADAAATTKPTPATRAAPQRAARPSQATADPPEASPWKRDEAPAPAAPPPPTDAPARPSILDLADRISEAEQAPQAPAPAPARAPAPPPAPAPAPKQRRQRKRDRGRGLPFEADDTPFAAVLQHVVEEDQTGAPQAEPPRAEPAPAPQPVSEQHFAEQHFAEQHFADEPFADETFADTVVTEDLPHSVEALALMERGLPEALLPRGLITEPDLCAALDQLPAPPPMPTAMGSVIAVVGERTSATDLARTIAQELRQDPAAVVVASATRQSAKKPEHLRLSRLDQASDRVRAWRRRKAPTIVVVDNALGATTSDWATAMLEVLEPSVSIGVVQASIKIEDIAAWDAQLGGLDELVVEGLAQTVTPAAILALGIPVARLDDRLATAAYWTAILMERLSE